MNRRVKRNPAAILLSKRAHVLYLEHARVVQKDGRVLYLSDEGPTAEVDRFFNVPQRNTALLLLGQGTSITDSAARLLAESDVLVGFAGTGGSPLHSAVDPVFLAGQSEYRPTEYMQDWMRLWLDEERRLAAAKRFQVRRIAWIDHAWAANEALGSRAVLLEERELRDFDSRVHRAASTSELLGVEADWTKALYRRLSAAFKVEGFVRQAGGERTSEGKAPTERANLANSLLDHGNYIAYGYAAVALYALGISFALPVLHGKTRRGGLVFDIADLFKDAYVLPLAFEWAGRGERGFREELIERLRAGSVVDGAIDTIKSVLAK